MTLRLIAIFIQVLFLHSNAFAADLTGRVIKVYDGDTITIIDSAKNQHRIRLAQIDAPERNQPWGTKSRNNLNGILSGNNVTVKVHGKDNYGRVIGTVFLNGIDLCKEQVKSGNAWVFTRYAFDNDLVAIQRSAEENKIGLWGLTSNERIQPWVWRQQQKLHKRNE